jgi:hypothetical protein
MGVRVERFPEHEVTLCVFSGVITAEVIREHLSLLEPEDVARRVTYADPTADISDLAMTHFPQLKREIASRLNELLAGKRGVSALVSTSRQSKLAYDFWATYVGLDGSFPVEVRSFERLEAACAWLAIRDAGCKRMIAATKSHAPRPEMPGSNFAGARQV